MVSIVLVDRNCVVHEVFLIPSCTQEDLATVEVCARQHGLSAIVRTATVVHDASDACDEISSITNSITDEVEACTSHDIIVDDTMDPVVEINHVCASSDDFDDEHPHLELDWES